LNCKTLTFRVEFIFEVRIVIKVSLFDMNLSKYFS